MNAMIKVQFADGDVVIFEDASRWATDEHNNLEIYGGPAIGRQPPSQLMDVIAEGHWVRVGIHVDDEDDDED